MQHSFRYAIWPPRVRTVSVSQGWSCARTGAAWRSSVLIRSTTNQWMCRFSMADPIVGPERAITSQVVVRRGDRRQAVPMTALYTPPLSYIVAGLLMLVSVLA